MQLRKSIAPLSFSCLQKREFPRYKEFYKAEQMNRSYQPLHLMSVYGLLPILTAKHINSYSSLPEHGPTPPQFRDREHQYHGLLLFSPHTHYIVYLAALACFYMCIDRGISFFSVCNNLFYTINNLVCPIG